MAFFPRIVNNADSSFTPLFRFLDDFDKHTRQGASAGTSSNGRRGLFQWQPKFDIRETADAYELHGELPGMNKDNVDIEFPEAQTMHVRGKVERTYTAGTSPAGQLEGASTTSGAITEGGSERRNSHQATVEDENETGDAAAANTEVAEKPADKKPVDNAKYWLTERSIGEFSRSFTFPSRVDQDAVSASLKDGILSIVVPKAKKHESRRIAVN